MSTQKSTSRSLTTVETTQEARPQSEYGELTWEEEMVTRMMYGLSEDDTFELEFRVSPNPEERARLLYAESAMVKWLRSRTATSAVEPGAEQSALDILKGKS